MLRIASLSLLVLSLPTYAQGRPQRGSDIDRKLNMILERLEVLEKRVSARDGDRKQHDASGRTERLHRFLREFDREDRRQDARRAPRRDRDHARPDRQRGPQRDFRRGGRRPHPQKDMQRGPGGVGSPAGMEKLHKLMAAAAKGDPQARQMLMQLRKKIDAILGNKKGKKTKRVEFQTKSTMLPGGFKVIEMTDVPLVKAPAVTYGFKAAKAKPAKQVEVARRRKEIEKAHRDIVIREKNAYVTKKKMVDEMTRMKKLIAESRRLQEEIRELRKELAAQQR